MRKVIVAAFVSLDGVMQAPGGPHEDPTGGFEFGGWVAPLADDGFGKGIESLFARPFDLLLGRKTYEIFAAYWPYAGDHPIGVLFNRATKHVATRDPGFALSWENSRLVGPDAVEGVRRLKAEDGPDLLTQGSSGLLQSLFAADLVDELQVMTFPILLGKGKRLFQGGAAPRAFNLTSSTATAQGVTIARYERDGEVRTGTFEADQPSEAELRRRAALT